MQSSDPIGLFIEKAIQRTHASGNKTETKEGVYQAYDNFCMDKRLAKETSETFSRRLKNEGFEYKQKKIDGRNTRVWLDIELKDYRQAEEGQETL